jgi:hypothetical protein
LNENSGGEPLSLVELPKKICLSILFLFLVTSWWFLYWKSMWRDLLDRKKIPQIDPAKLHMVQN